ncbi:MAG: carboxypeptidase regulatory-like domain-containing protein [Acidobacteriota bacterium]
MVNGATRRWNLTTPANPNAVDAATGEVLWHLDTDGSDDVPFMALEPAAQAAFDTWQAVSFAGIEFRSAGGLNVMPGEVLLGMADTLNSVVWLESPLDATFDVVARTVVRFNANGEIMEADIVLNGATFLWSVNLDGTVTTRDGPQDVQSILTHEVGHFAGLDHAFRQGGSTMFFTAHPAGALNGRGLKEDDIAGLRFLYPDGVVTGTGTISGAVTRGGTGLKGVLVEAFQNGAFVASAITEPAGSYKIERLPPGAYQVRARRSSCPPASTAATWSCRGPTLSVRASTSYEENPDQSRRLRLPRRRSPP